MPILGACHSSQGASRAVMELTGYLDQPRPERLRFSEGHPMLLADFHNHLTLYRSLEVKMLHL